MSKTYNIEIIYCEDMYHILDFTINRVHISKEFLPEVANAFARGYKQGIEIDSYLKYQPEIISGKYIGNIKDYIKDRKKHYEKIWDKENKDK